VHPHHASDFNEHTLHTIEGLLTDPQCCSVGECGLDFNRNFSTPEQQLHAFEMQVVVIIIITITINQLQLQLACRLQKPLFIHERDAFTEMCNLLTKYSSNLPKAVIHCFTGTSEQAKKYIDMGLYIGLTGLIQNTNKYKHS
jgi:TatD DNase family protein